ncbi:NtrZ family periplasmic regulatory protein [Maricaulis sp. CAU 1757]
MIRRVQPFGIKTGTTALGKSAGAALAAALFLCASPAFAQQQDVPAIEDAETPWYEAFTLSMNESTPPSLVDLETFDVPLNGGRWGLSLGIEEAAETPFQREDLSAGAFVNFGDRIRLGGQLRLATPDSVYLTPSEPVERQPEIKFESALRF